MRVRYVGHKDRKADNVAGTGVVWHGHGDVQTVPDAAWGKLGVHPDVWERVAVDATTTGLASAPAAAAPPAPPAAPEAPAPPAPPPEPPAPPAPPEAKFVLVSKDGAELVLDTMDDAALRGFADTNGLAVDGRFKGDKLRGAIVDAVKAASQG